MEREIFFLQVLNEKERAILKDLFFHEPDCAKFISRRLRLDLKETMESLKLLENMGIIERTLATFIKKGRFYKHRNHTYYEIKREWKNFLKKYLWERS